MKEKVILSFVSAFVFALLILNSNVKATDAKYSIENANVPSISDYEYTGKAINPNVGKITYTANGKTWTLKEGTDYEIYKSTYPTSTGPNQIWIYGRGEFSGYKTVEYKVVPDKLKNVKAELKTNKIKVTWNKSLVENKAIAYMVQRKASDEKSYKTIFQVYDRDHNSYNDTNVKTGKTYKYRVRTFMNFSNRSGNGYTPYYGKYASTSNTTFVHAVDYKVTSYNDKAKITWNKVSKASGYQVFRATSKNGNYKRIKTLSGQNKLSYTDKSIKKFTTYYYKVRAYKTINGKRTHSVFKDAKEKSALAKVDLTKVKNSSGNLKLTWSKLKDISGYQIYRADYGTRSFKKIGTASSKKTTYTDRTVKNGKGYVYKVRAYKNKNGKKIYGSYSNEKLYALGGRKTQMNKIKLVPDQNFENSGYSSYYEYYEEQIKKLTNLKMTTYQKVKTMYEYVVKTLAHKDGYHCKHFAATFAGICRVIGLNAYCAEGKTKGGSGYTEHTWTVININGTEYIFDASLERHSYDSNKKISYKYFFKKYSELKGVYKQEGYEDGFPYFMVGRYRLKK